MSQSRLSVHKIREVLRLHAEDVSLSNRAIARACNIAPSTVGEYLRRAKDAGLAWPLPENLSEEELFDRIFAEIHEGPWSPGARRQLQRIPDWSFIHQELKRRGVTLKLLWQEDRQAYPDGYQYSQFCERYRRWAYALDVTMRIPHRGGEEVEVDYAGATIEIVNPATGEITRAYVFVAVLPASGYFYVEVQPECTLPHWIGGNVRALEFFGGVPRILIPDNLKTGVKRPEFYEPDINPTFQYFAEHYGLVVLPTRIHHPQDKAHAENTVQQVTRWILAPLRNRKFFSVAEANQAVNVLAKAVRNRPMKQLGKSRRELFVEIDQPALRPLPERPYAYTEIKLAKVHIDYHVEYDRHHYSVLYTLRGEQLEIRAGEHVIQLFFKRNLVATHVRSRLRGGFTTLPEHMPSQHRFVQEVLRSTRNGPSWVVERAGRIGPQTAAFVQAIFAARKYPEQGIRSGLGVLSLGRKYPAERIERACSRMVSLNRLGCRHLKQYLEREDLSSPPILVSPQPMPPHANLRGPESFHAKGG